MCAFAHGDDSVTSGSDRDLKYVQEFFCNRYMTKVRGILRPHPSDTKAMVILSLTTAWRDDIAIEADPRRV